MESGPRKVATPAASRLQIELRKPVSSAGAPVQTPPTKEVVVVEDVVESSKDKKEKKEQVEGSAVMLAGGEDSGGAIEGPPSKEHAAEVSGKEVGVSVKEEEKQGFVNDEGETGMISKNIEPLSVKETDGVAVESEVSKGVFSLRNNISFSQSLGARCRDFSHKVDLLGRIQFETFILPMLDKVVQKEGSLSSTLFLLRIFLVLFNSLAFICFESRHVSNFACTWHATFHIASHTCIGIKHIKVMSLLPCTLYLQSVHKDPVMLVEASSGTLYKINQVNDKHEVS